MGPDVQDEYLCLLSDDKGRIASPEEGKCHRKLRLDNGP